MTGNEQENLRVGATLKALRLSNGLSLDELARRLYISTPYLANIEAGRRRLPPKVANQAATVLNIPRLALIRDDYTTRQKKADKIAQQIKQLI